MIFSADVVGGFYFIGTPMTLDVALPMKISEGLRIDKASDAQIDTIHQFLATNHPFYASRRTLYETDWIRDTTNPNSFSPLALPKPKWRYNVLTFSGTPSEAETFQRASNLCDLPIDCYPWALFTEQSFGQGEVIGASSSGAMPFIFNGPPRTSPAEPLPVVTQNTLDQWLRSYRRLASFEADKHPGIAKAVSLFHDLKTVNPVNGFRVLGLFMIIEMLLTHNPGNKEIGDSLCHQIATKVPLLSQRFEQPLDYSDFNSKEGTIWTRLYDYRSKVAHGDTADFDSKLSLLKNAAFAEMFLTKATRRLLAHALQDPALYDALKPI